MNDITYAVSVDVNSPIIPYNVYVASVLDSNVRYLEITLCQNGNVITLSNTATATASLVTDNVLVDDSVNCTISNNIITVPLEGLQRHGNLDVQVIVTEDTKVLAIPFPIQVRVTPNIAENAQIDENSSGSYAEVVHEIAEARGSYDKLKDRLDHTADIQTLDEKEDKENKVNAMTGTYDTTHYPSVKAVLAHLGSAYYDRAAIDRIVSSLASEIPTAVSELENDRGFLSEHQDISGKANSSDVYTKAQTNEALNGKTDVQTTAKNRAEVLGGAIVPEMERGSIRNTPTDYIAAQSYIRTKEGFDMWLNPGAVIALTDYAGARFKVWCTHPDGTYTQSGWLTAVYSVSEFGFYKIVMSHDPEEVLSDSDVEELAARLRVTNVGIAGYQEANALAPLILGLNGTAYINFSVNMDATPPTATMTIPPDTLLMTTQGHIQLSAQAVTVDFSAINSTAIQIIYNKNTGTVDVVNYQSHDRNYIPIAVLRRNLTDRRYTPLTVSINAPYRINGRWYNLPFSETLTPMILGNSAENYVSVDTKTHTITFPADTLLMVGGDSGYVSLNGNQPYTIDYSVANSTAVKLYYNTNTGTMFVTKFNDNYYCFYPLIAVMRVQRYDNDTVYPSVSIAAPVVIDGKPNGYSDPSRVNNALLKNINHRGYNTVAPENTLPAFRLSKKKGFDVVETDVQRTSDGMYVCLHDREINRTARNADGTEISETVNIDGITYAQASTYDFGIWKSQEYAGTKIPTLVQFVRLCRNIGLEMYIELKTETITTQQHVNEIVAIVRENGMINHCTWISFSEGLLRYVLDAFPAARVGFLCNDAGISNVTKAKSLRGDEFELVNDVFLNLPWNVVNGTALDLAISESFPVEVWVVSSNAEPNFININPYVTGFTSNKELGSNALYDRYI